MKTKRALHQARYIQYLRASGLNVKTIMKVTAYSKGQVYQLLKVKLDDENDSKQS